MRNTCGSSPITASYKPHVQATTGYIWIADLVGAIHHIVAPKEPETSPFIEELPR